MRYFTAYLADGKRARVYEIDAQQYAQFKPDIRYITIQLPWIITGNDEDLLSTSGYMVPGAKTKNQKIVEYYKQQMPNLEKYLTNPLEYFSGTSIRIPEYIVPLNGTFVDVNSLANTGTVSGYNITASVAPEPTPPLVTSGLVLYYDAGNLASYPGSGSAVTDLGPFGYNTSLFSFDSQISFDSANSGSFVFNPGTEVNGKQTSIGLPQNSNMPWAYEDIPPMTLSFWVKFNSTLYTDATLMGYTATFGIENNGRRFQFVLENATNKLVVNRALVEEVGRFSEYTVTRGVITNIVLTKSGTQYSLYINGVFVSQFTSSATYWVGSNALGMNHNRGIFQTNFRAIQKMNGNIYNFIAYNTALSAADILQNYKAQKGRFGL